MIMEVRACASHTSSSFIFLTFVGLCLLQLSYSLPYIVLHGVGSSCTTTRMSNFTQYLRNFSGTQGYCIEIGNGQVDSWLWPVKKQIEIACEQVKANDALVDGYNIVAISHGNMIARGLIEFCDGAPKVHNYVSVAGPHAGIASIPFCGLKQVCDMVSHLIDKLGVYNDFVQEHIAPSGYIKIPNDTKSYLRGSTFLPYVNNEIAGKRNTTYKERFSSLDKLALIMFENDTVLVPKETSWFGFYPDGGPTNSAPIYANETKLYTEDWIGLRTLDEAGKVEFVIAPGGHFSLSSSLVKNYIIRYLKAQ